MPGSITKLSHRIASAWLNLPIRYKGGALIAIPVVCLLLAVLGLFPLHQEEENGERWTSHTQQIQVATGQLLVNLLAAESGVRGYVITHDPNELPAYHNLQSSLPESLNRIRSLVSDNPLQSARELEIERLARQRMVLAASNIAASTLLTRRPGSAGAAELAESISQGGEVTELLRKKIQIFIDEEDRLLELRSQRLQDERRFTSMFLLFTAGFGIAGGVRT